MHTISALHAYLQLGDLAWSRLCSRQAQLHCPPLTAPGEWAPLQQQQQGTGDLAVGLLWRAAVGSGCQMNWPELPLRLQLDPSPAMCSSAEAGQGLEWNSYSQGQAMSSAGSIQEPPAK